MIGLRRNSVNDYQREESFSDFLAQVMIGLISFLTKENDRLVNFMQAYESFESYGWFFRCFIRIMGG